LGFLDENPIKYKRDLADKYGVTGKALTRKLMKLGYDAIITRRTDYGGETGEIILFPNAKIKGLYN